MLSLQLRLVDGSSPSCAARLWIDVLLPALLCPIASSDRKRYEVEVAPKRLVQLKGTPRLFGCLKGELAQRHAARALLEAVAALKDATELIVQLAMR